MKANLSKTFNKFKSHIFNTSWMMVDKIFGMGLTFLVTVVLARYLGPDQFGVLSYALSLVMVFAVLGHVGLSGLVVRELVKNPDEKQDVMGTSFVLKSLGYVLGLVLILAYTFGFEEHGSVQFWILLILSISLFFYPFDVLDFWFQSRLEAKYSTLARSGGILISSAAKLGLVMAGAGLLWIAAAHILQIMVAVLLMIWFYQKKSGLSISSWTVSKQRAKELFSQAWLIFFGTLFAIIYLKVDQIMLKWLVGTEEVGVYAVAASLSEAWYFVPVAIVASFFPRLIELKEQDTERFHERLQKLFDLLFVVALFVAVAVTLVAEPVINLLFGEAYANSSSILVVHIWAALFIFMRALFSKWILIENVLIFSLVTQGLGALANVGLNFWLIPKYGGVGAAYATLIAYAMASYFSLMFYTKTRPVFWMMSRSILFPFRYVKRISI